MQSKISLIIAREYKTRVFKKSFLLLTFLTPLLLVALISVPLWLSTIKSDKAKNIIVVDKSGLYADAFVSDSLYHFSFSQFSVAEIRENASDEPLTGILYITGNLVEEGNKAMLYSEKQLDIETVIFLEKLLSSSVEHQKIAAYNIPNLTQMIKDAQTHIDITNIKWTENGEEKLGSAEIALAIGMITALIIYIFIVLYGAQVMNGVVQEKTNRIVEVIISSVKPFELMMGKIIGIAMVGLTQVFMWVAITLLFASALLPIISPDIAPQDLQQVTAMSNENMELQQTIWGIQSQLASFDLVKILLLFIVYFLGGYLLYASLFAACGSAVDNETDTQQFSLPLTIPIIFAIYAAIYSVQNPDGPLAFWCSIIPFTSPIVMMVRLPFDVAAWELLLSIGILVLSFIGTTWMAGKIYRTGILMYGKKVTWKELWKWIRY